MSTDKTVLVVEDEYVIAQMLSELLHDEGHGVMVAFNGMEGLHCLEQTLPDVILTDIMMPIMDGLAFCKTIQAQPQYQTIPVIILSAVSDRSEIVDCQFAAVVSKPFDIDVLLAKIMWVLDSVE